MGADDAGLLPGRKREAQQTQLGLLGKGGEDRRRSRLQWIEHLGNFFF